MLLIRVWLCPWLHERALVVCLTLCVLGVPQPLTIAHVEHRGHPMVDLGVVTASVVREDDCCWAAAVDYLLALL